MDPKQNRTRRVATCVAMAMLILGGGGIAATIRTQGFNLSKTPIYPMDNRQLSNLPTETDRWIRSGSDHVEPTEILEVLGTENYLTREYIEKEPADPRRPIMLHFHGAYYTGGIDTVPHVPERCFVGGGLQQTTSSTVIPLRLDTSDWAADRSVPEELGGQDGKVYTTRLSNDYKRTDAPGLRVRLPRNVSPESLIEMRFSEFTGGESTIYAGYFFIANGRTKANANDVRALAFNLEDDYAYYLKIQISANTVGSMDEFVEAASVLIGETLGEIMRCVPDWTEVQSGRYPEDNPNGIQD
jgi:hypothetical protein